MAIVADTQHAVDILHGIQDRLEDSGDVALSQQVAVMVKLLDSPSFKQLLNLQQAIKQLKEHINTTPPGTEGDFDFSPQGELVLPHEAPKEADPRERPVSTHPYAFENVTFEHDEDTITPSVAAVAASAPVAAGPPTDTATQGRRISMDDERLKDLAFNRDLVAVDLVKPEKGGLGFTVVGLNSKSHGDLGIFVQKIQPDTVASRDGRLHDSDQILAINDQILHAGISHKDAIAMLHKIEGEVHLIIARGDFDLPPPAELKTAEQTEQEPAQEDSEGEESTGDLDSDGNIQTIELTNDGGGLGFGIVGVTNTGIVVKTIVPGGVAERDGRLESGDIILQIGETSLEGMNSTKVAGVLRQSGNHVKLTVIKKGIRVPQAPVRTTLPQEPVIASIEDPREESAPPAPVTSPPPDVAVDIPQVELEYFEVDLQKTSQGLGLSIAGFEENRPDGVEAGIFVKGIAAGSAADLSKQITVGDQIIEVDGQSVHGYGNRQAVELLRRTGSLVQLKLARRSKKAPVNGTPEYATLESPVVLPVVTPDAAPRDDKDAVSSDESEPESEEQEEEETAIEEADVRVEAVAAAALMSAAPPKPAPVEPTPVERTPVEPAPVEPAPVELAPVELVWDEPAREEPPVVAASPPVALAAPLTYPRKDPAVQTALWQSMLGPSVTILVSDVEKEGSLGIVLEGRMDIDEQGQEIQPRHYISTVVDQGPIGKQGLLIPGDELLEVNGIRLYGRNHPEVVDILRGLPANVHLICGRHAEPPRVIGGDPPIQPMAHEVVEQAPRQLEESQPPTVPTIDEPDNRSIEGERSPTVISGDTVSVHSDTPSGVSHDSLMGVSVWSDQVQMVTLVKGDQGLGFSILDYQDPLKPDSNVILIRSLVEGGIAERDGRLIPGDRLMSVNDVNLENASLETAVEAVRSAPRGQVRIGIAKPLPSAIIEEQKEALAQQTKEEEKRMSLERDVPVVAVSASIAHAAAPAKNNPPDLIAYEPPKPAPRKSLESSSPPPEPAHRAPPPPVAISSPSSSLMVRPDYVELPVSLERTLVLKRQIAGMDQANGAIIKSIIRGGCVHEDGTLSVGDYITAVNGDSTRNMSNANVRGLLRKCFFGGSEISLTYILASDAAAYRDQVAASRGSTDSDDEIWEDIRVVEVYREPGRSLGISILGGRVGQGLLEGIFIKHVLEDSPAGKTGELKTGDRILEVNDCDLRDATHDQAVAIIKNAPNPVKFKVQSLTPELQPAYLSEIDGQPYQATLIMSTDGDKSDTEDGDGDQDSLSVSSAEGSESEPEDEYGYTHRIIRERYQEVPGEYLILEIPKVGRSLGLSLAGNKDTKVLSVFVVGIHPESPAAIEGSIMIADELMEINGIKVFGHTHREASMIISDLPEGSVKLVVRRRPEAVSELSVPYVQDTPDSQVPSALKEPKPGAVLDLTDGGDLNEESGEIDFTKFPNVHTITLHKGATGLGFFIYEKKDQSGRAGIFVKEISHGGAAGQEGSLQVDDQVLAVDDLPLIGLSKLSAISVLKATRGKVELTVSSVKLQSTNPYLMASQGEDTPDGKMEEPVITKSATETVHSQPADDDDSDLDPGPLAAPILQKAQTSIILDRGSRDMGLKIAGGSDTDIPIIIIDEVYKGGAAARDGRLRPGDQLLAVNGIQLSDVTHAEALQVLEDVPALVPMIVFRVESDATSTETWEEEEVEIRKKEGQGLGLSIVGKKNDKGVFISDIVIGGVAFRDGRLRRGDRLLSIEGKDVVNAPKNVVAPMLKNAVGTIKLKVGRLTADTMEPEEAEPTPEEPDSTTAPKEESLMSELMNDPQLDPAGGESGYSQDEEQEEVVDPGAPIQTVILERGPDGLGFSIVGGHGSPHGDLPIYIKTVFDRGAAIESGVLKRGDQIVEVNGRDLRGANHKEAVSLLKQVTGTVELKIISR